ncbi:MAG: hypothetical protein ACON4T_07220 [Synechococcus sp.]
MEVTTLADGCLRVCLQQDGFESCCMVSSYHLVESKRPQLERANLRLASKALGHAYALNQATPSPQSC